MVKRSAPSIGFAAKDGLPLLCHCRTEVVSGNRYQRINSDRTCKVEKVTHADEHVVHFFYDDAQASGVTWAMEQSEFLANWKRLPD